MCKAIPPIVLIFIFLLPQVSSPSAITDLHIYETGTKFTISARWWGLSAEGTIEIMENTDFRGEDTILVRSQVTKMGGLMGFIARFLRVHDESNTGDTYIDPDSFLVIGCEGYKQEDDGSRKLTDQIYFDRGLNKILSLMDNKTMARDTAPDIQDSISAFLNLICRLNTEVLFVGKIFRINLYSQKKAFELKIRTTDMSMVDGRSVYTLYIAEVPEVFKYPVSAKIKVADNGDGLNIPTEALCTVDVPILPNITIRAELKEVKRAGSSATGGTQND